MEKQTEKVAIPNGGYAVKAVYTEQLLDEYKCNPLIEALPPILSEEEVIERLAVYPPFNSKERNLDVHYRFHCVQRLFRYFQPLEKHIDIEQRFSRVIRQGYIARNPMGPDYAARLQQGYKIIKSGSYTMPADIDMRSTASGFTIIGISGIGKTTAIQRVLSLYPQIIVHSNYKGLNLSLYQVPWLKLDCPFDGSLKGLCIDFFIAIDRLLGTNYYKKFGSTRNSIDSMLPRMAQIASLHCLGVLIIDEIQHLSLAKSGGSDKMLNFFVTLVNTIGVPVILIGTTKALSILQGEFRQARRGTGQGDMVWERMTKDDRWDLLIEGMWHYQWTLKEVPLSEEIKQVLYEESQGIVDLAVKLYVMAQLRAIASGKEAITSQLIRKVAQDNLKLVKPMLDALKSGKITEIAKYDDIRPVDLEGFYNEQLSQIRITEKINNIKRQAKTEEAKSIESLIEQVILKLLELDIEPALAKKSVEQVIASFGADIDVALLTKEAAKIALVEESHTKKQVKKQKKKESILDPLDLRVIVEAGKRNRLPAYESLNAKGYIKSPSQELLSLG